MWVFRVFIEMKKGRGKDFKDFKSSQHHMMYTSKSKTRTHTLWMVACASRNLFLKMTVLLANNPTNSKKPTADEPCSQNHQLNSCATVDDLQNKTRRKRNNTTNKSYSSTSVTHSQLTHRERVGNTELGLFHSGRVGPGGIGKKKGRGEIVCVGRGESCVGSLLK